jgi:uncharacterized protein (DUF1778 family)
MPLRDARVQDATLSIRLYSDELNTIKKAAKTAGKTLAEAVREVMLAWSKRQSKKAA